MNEPRSHEPSETPVLGASAAFRLGALLLAGLALVLGLAIVDRQRRAAIEGWEEVTAVGDSAYFVQPSATAAPAVVSWQGGELRIANGEREKFRDTQMRRAGTAASAGISIYEKDGRRFVKIAPGEYLPAQ